MRSSILFQNSKGNTVQKQFDQKNREQNH